MCDVEAKSKADSLWVGMMDICKRFGISPSLIDELFGYVKPFREMEFENARLQREREELSDDCKRLHSEKVYYFEKNIVANQHIEELEGALRENAQYQTNRYESILDHINNENYHMAAAKILADLSALRGMQEVSSSHLIGGEDGDT